MAVNAYKEDWSCQGKCNRIHRTESYYSISTLPTNKTNPIHSIALCWPDFQSFNSHTNIVIFKKNLTQSCSSWFYASFDPFRAQIFPVPRNPKTHYMAIISARLCEKKKEYKNIQNLKFTLFFVPWNMRTYKDKE